MKEGLDVCVCSCVCCMSCKHKVLWTFLCRRRGSGTFWRASIWKVVGVRVIQAVTVGGGETAGIDEVLVGLTLIGC